MARHKVEICGVNTANMKVLSSEETKELFQVKKLQNTYKILLFSCKTLFIILEKTSIALKGLVFKVNTLVLFEYHLFIFLKALFL